MEGEKRYSDIQFAENSFYRAYSLALKAACSIEGTISRIEKIPLNWI
jgi:hypothetical protein